MDKDLAYYGNATGNKVRVLRKRYDMLKEKIRGVGVGVGEMGALWGRWVLSTGEKGRGGGLICVESVREECPYYSLLFEISGDGGMVVESGRVELGEVLKQGLGDVGAGVGEGLVLGNEELVGGGVRGEGKSDGEETEEAGSDDGGGAGGAGEYNEYDSEVFESYENQGEVQNKTQDEIHTSEGPPLKEHTPKELKSTLQKRPREDDSSEDDTDKNLDGNSTKLDRLRYKIAHDLHLEKIRRKQDRFDVKVRERRAERKHERYMIDAKIKLAQIEYGLVGGFVEEEE